MHGAHGARMGPILAKYHLGFFASNSLAVIAHQRSRRACTKCLPSAEVGQRRGCPQKATTHVREADEAIWKFTKCVCVCVWEKERERERERERTSPTTVHPLVKSLEVHRLWYFCPVHRLIHILRPELPHRLQEVLGQVLFLFKGDDHLRDGHMTPTSVRGNRTEMSVTPTNVRGNRTVQSLIALMGMAHHSLYKVQIF